jgi:tetratricopeptide (TPR) repeat protein
MWGNMTTAGRTRQSEENLYLLVEVLDVLRIAIEAYQDGHQSAWLIISARLHQLLTDKAKKQIPLALRVIPELELHPMRQNLRDREVDFILASPVGIHSTEKGFSLEIFDTSKLRVSLSDWLNQIAYIIESDEITLQQLIEEPRHQAGAVHFDPVLRPSMRRIEGILLYAFVGEKQLSFRDYLVAIGAYVQAELNAQTIAALGNGYRQQANFEKTSEFYESALQSFIEIKDLQGQSEQWNNKGYLAYLQGDFAVAKKYYQIAQNLNQQLGWKDATVNVNNNLAIVCLELGNHFMKISPEKAISEYLTALIAGEANNDATHQSIALANLSDTYIKIGKNLEALIAVLLPLVMNYQMESNLKARIEQRAKTLITNLSVPVRELVEQIKREPDVAISSAVDSKINTSGISSEDFVHAIEILIQDE